MIKDRKKHFLTLLDYSPEEISDLVEKAKEMKSQRVNLKLLPGKVLLMLFEKTSTRTRISFETAMTQLGGHAIFMEARVSKIKEGEALKDSARVFSEYVDGVMARLYKQEDLEEIAEHSKVPVINGLTDAFHPCQTLSDILTVKEYKGNNLEGLKLAFVGDCGYNMAQSTMIGFSKMGVDVNLVCPDKKIYQPMDWVWKKAKKQFESEVKLVHDPVEGVKDVDIVYTDTWVSPGQKNREQRIKDLRPFQVNSRLIRHAKKDAIVMHCLPAFRGFEITDDVIDGPQSIVFHQAQNRLHAQKALLVELLGNQT